MVMSKSTDYLPGIGMRDMRLTNDGDCGDCVENRLIPAFYASVIDHRELSRIYMLYMNYKNYQISVGENCSKNIMDSDGEKQNAEDRNKAVEAGRWSRVKNLALCFYLCL